MTHKLLLILQKSEITSFVRRSPISKSLWVTIWETHLYIIFLISYLIVGGNSMLFLVVYKIGVLNLLKNHFC